MEDDCLIPGYLDRGLFLGSVKVYHLKMSTVIQIWVVTFLLQHLSVSGHCQEQDRYAYIVTSICERQQICVHEFTCTKNAGQ